MLKLTIGKACIAIEGVEPERDQGIEPAYRPFVSDGKPEIRLCLHQGLPNISVGEEVFDCSPIWTLYRQNGNSVIKIPGSRSYPDVATILVLPSRLDEADLYSSKQSALETDLFQSPAPELLMVNYLARGRGVMLHACGIALNGKGILFVGESGAGKSTMAGICGKEKGVEVLSDDRIIVRKIGAEYWIYGTPWHGDAPFASPTGVGLKRILFLRHGQRNTVSETHGIDTVSRLFTYSFSPHWDMPGMA
jgi:hypothetical protein